MVSSDSSVSVQFFDRQDSTNPHHGAVLSGADMISSLFKEERTKSPHFCELIGANGYKLLLGVSASLGCAQYSAADGSPPYLMAIGDKDIIEEGYVEFAIADTDTPVPRRFCLPIGTIEQVARDFVANGTRSSTVDWEEI